MDNSRPLPMPGSKGGSRWPSLPRTLNEKVSRTLLVTVILSRLCFDLIEGKLIESHRKKKRTHLWNPLFELDGPFPVDQHFQLIPSIISDSSILIKKNIRNDHPASP